MNKRNMAKHLASLTVKLVASYQENYTRIAMERGITESEFRCLRLMGLEKGLSNKRIADRMSLSQSRLTRIVDGLCEKGFMTRESNPKDFRSLKLTLSRKAKSLIQKMDKLNEDLHYKILNEISIPQQKALIAAMEKLFAETPKWLAKFK
jgi:MarR family transcriptional regulator, organic hydroperoxide resistance regulator